MNKDQVKGRFKEAKGKVKGRFKEAKGKVKEIAGKIVGNKDLEQEGKIQNTEGKVQAGCGDLKQNIKDAL
jgi:uncharacterized protein YjbJ (UPF0337 family)